MSGATKLMTASGGGVILTPASAIASDVTVNIPSANCTVLTTTSAGTVLQVVQGTPITYVSTTSTTYVDTGLTASITPSSTTSKILVSVFINGMCTASNSSTSYQAYMQLTDGSNNQIQFLLDQFVPGGAYGQIFMPYTLNYLASPSTTSSITYKVRYKGDASSHGIALGNYNGGPYFGGTITLMEIAA